jgi:hypothetical protein
MSSARRNAFPENLDGSRRHSGSMTCSEKVAWPDNRSAWPAVATESERSILRLEEADVVCLLQDEPAFSKLFLSHLLSRNIWIEEDLIDLLFNSSWKRLARVLLMAKFGKGPIQ